MNRENTLLGTDIGAEANGQLTVNQSAILITDQSFNFKSLQVSDC